MTHWKYKKTNHACISKKKKKNGSVLPYDNNMLAHVSISETVMNKLKTYTFICVNVEVSLHQYKILNSSW